MKPPAEQLKESMSHMKMAEFAYNKDNPQHNNKGEPPSMVYEMSEKAWKLWHLKDFITTHTISILQGEIDRLKIEKIKPNWNGQYTSYDSGYNQAISDQILHLEEEIRKIKELS